MSLYDLARLHLDAGISLIPIAVGADKAPDGKRLPRVLDESTGLYAPSWSPYKGSAGRLATDKEARDWWRGPRPSGFAAVAGEISGNLELIDFDGPQAPPNFHRWATLVAEECPALFSSPRLCLVATPSGGRHCWLCCPDVVTPGSRKLAVDPAQQGKRTLVETRGEGGYALVPGCPPECHPLGRPYTLLPGGRSLVEMRRSTWVSPDERDCMIRCARALDRSPPREDAPPRQVAGAIGLLPGTDFDLRGPDWAEVLTPHGWVLAGGHGAERRWRRPGKERGWSATTGHCRGKDGADLLRVFSSNAAPFEDGKAYGKFRALSLLEHGGDWAACARWLADHGYGSLSEAERARHGLPRRPSKAEMERVIAVLIDYPGEVKAALEGLVAGIVEERLRGRGPGHG